MAIQGQLFWILVISNYISCNIYDGCSNENLYNYGEEQNFTCLDLEQMHISPTICFYGHYSPPCTITFLGKIGILRTNSFSRLQNLEQVFLNGTEISKVEKMPFLGSPNIRLIHLERNNIEIIPEDVFASLPHLEFLDLHDNKISEINGETIIPQLYYVDISNNKLEDFPPSLITKNLRTLNISKNSIGDIHQQIFSDLTALENLIVDHNEISSISDSLFPPNLETLSIAYNKLQDMDKSLPSSLKYLNLSGNQISVIQTKNFVHLEELISLDLSNNKLKNLPFGLFEHMRNLSYLDLSSNSLKTIENGVFYGALNLRYLNLSRNSLEWLDTSVFYSLTIYANVDLSKNQLNHLNINLIGKFLSGMHLYIDGNTFNCPDLINIVVSARENDIQIPAGHSFGTKNFNGIACIDEITDITKPSLNQTNIQIFNQLVREQTNLLRNISTEIIKNQKIIQTSMTQKIDNTNKLSEKLIESNKELIEKQQLQTGNLSKKLDVNNQLVKEQTNLLRNIPSEIIKNQKSFQNSMAEKKTPNIIDNSNKLLEKLIETNKELMETQKIQTRNFSKEMVKVLNDLVPNISNKMEVNEEHRKETEISGEKAESLTSENSDIRNLIVSFNELKILFTVSIIIMIMLCIVKLIKTVKSSHLMNKYTLDNQELPFIDRLSNM